MTKYYLMAIERGNVEAMNNLGYYHQKITKNYDEMIKYYKMAMDKGNNNNDTLLKNNNDILYQLDWEKTDNRILKNFNDYNNYMRKIQIISKIEECPICINEEICIPVFDCFHNVCVKCYPKIKYERKCPICRYEE